MGFHNTCNIWQTLLATLFMPRMGHHPLSGGGKAARQPGGKRERKGKKRKEKTREIRLASKIHVAQFRPLDTEDRFETNRGEKFHGENTQQVRNETDSPYEGSVCVESLEKKGRWIT